MDICEGHLPPCWAQGRDGASQKGTWELARQTGGGQAGDDSVGGGRAPVPKSTCMFTNCWVQGHPEGASEAPSHLSCSLVGQIMVLQGPLYPQSSLSQGQAAYPLHPCSQKLAEGERIGVGDLSPSCLAGLGATTWCSPLGALGLLLSRGDRPLPLCSPGASREHYHLCTLRICQPRLHWDHAGRPG